MFAVDTYIPKYMETTFLQSFADFSAHGPQIFRKFIILYQSDTYTHL